MSIFMPPKSQEYSVIDPIQPETRNGILNEGKLNRKLSKNILKLTDNISKEFEISFKKIWLVGSILTKQWNKNSDIDITLITDQTVENDVYRGIIRKNNEKFKFKGHPVNFYIMDKMPNLFKFDAIYDIQNDFWVKKPQDVEQQDIDDLIVECSATEFFQEILEAYADLKNSIESDEDPKYIFRKAIKFTLLVDDLTNQRRSDFDLPAEEGLAAASQRCSNVCYKLLESYGLKDLAVIINDFLDAKIEL